MIIFIVLPAGVLTVVATVSLQSVLWLYERNTGSVAGEKYKSLAVMMI